MEPLSLTVNDNGAGITTGLQGSKPTSVTDILKAPPAATGANVGSGIGPQEIPGDGAEADHTVLGGKETEIPRPLLEPDSPIVTEQLKMQSRTAPAAKPPVEAVAPFTAVCKPPLAFAPMKWRKNKGVIAPLSKGVTCACVLEVVTQYWVGPVAFDS